MRTNVVRAGMLVLALIPFAWGYSQALQGNPTRIDTPGILKQMTAPRWTVRSQAFSDARSLLSAGGSSGSDAEKLRLGIINLLVLENVRSRATDHSDIPEPDADAGSGEARSDYYATLIETVADLGDERAIPALLSAAGSGGFATRGVARFGTRAIDLVVRQVRGPDLRLAADALWVIRDMLAFHTVKDRESLARLKETLRFAVASPDSHVRKCALYAIEYLGDREEFMPILTEIAANDPAKINPLALANPNAGGFYPVRHQASLLLNKIKNHEPVPMAQMEITPWPDTAESGTRAKTQ